MRSLLVATVGVGGAFLLCFTVMEPMKRDAGALVGTAFIATALPAMLGAVILHGLRARSVQAQAVVVALMSVVGTVGGVVFASARMFLSPHDRDVLVIVALAAATTGVLSALHLGDRVGRATANLSEVTRRIAVGEPGGSPPSRAQGSYVGPEEFTRLARELAEMERQLDGAESARRELVAWISHDLRTPLAGIRALVEALEDGVVSDAATVARYHRTIREHSDRLAALVNDLFEMSRLQAGALRLERQPVGLAELVSDALAGMSEAADAKGVHLAGEVSDGGRTVPVSAREIGRALQNLLDNAVRHTPHGGRVTVVASVQNAQARIDVQDTGGGIDRAHLPRIFEVGYTADRARSDGGAGLGLAIARGFVDAHGGSIEVATDDRGACFTVLLPLATVATGALEPAP